MNTLETKRFKKIFLYCIHYNGAQKHKGFEYFKTSVPEQRLTSS